MYKTMLILIMVSFPLVVYVQETNAQTDSQGEQLFVKGAELQMLADGFQFTEGPVPDSKELYITTRSAVYRIPMQVTAVQQPE